MPTDELRREKEKEGEKERGDETDDLLQEIKHYLFLSLKECREEIEMKNEQDII